MPHSLPDAQCVKKIVNIEKPNSMDLLAGDSDDEEENGFKINENYAKNYENWRKKEEKQKLIDRYGDADLSTSSTEEDEIRSTPQMDKDWLRAYAVVRFQQSRLYKEGEKFFHDEAKPVSKKKEKATTLKDHERKFLLEKAGIESDEDSKPQQQEGKSYFEEQEEIKQSFKEALNDISDEDEGLLVRREKTAEEKKKEENDYLEWIKGMKEDLDDKEAAAELAPLKAYWNDPNLSEKEKVLRDYILNNGYIDQEDSSTDESDDDKIAELPNFETEEEFLEKAEEYEHKFNFRHEEPGGDELKSYPRVIEASVRTKDTRRADQRQRKLDKKRTLKEQRTEEIRLLQKIQMEERKEKLERLRKIADNTELEYDLETDFDPEEHNKLMQKFFNDDYYGDDEAEIKKPEFEYDAAVDDEPDNWWQERLNEEKQVDSENHKEETNEEEYEPGPDDPDFIMDADYDPSCDYKAERKKNKKKKKKGLVEKLPLFDPTKKTFDEYINEYLKDKIDSLPFTYREVVPNDFGLSTEEILKAPERELNSWVSVKKMSQYKSKQDEMEERRKFQSRARNFEKKVKILPSLSDKEPKKKSKKKKKKKKVEAGVDQGAVKSATADQSPPVSAKRDDRTEVKQSEKSVPECLQSNTTDKKRKRKESENSEVEVKRQKQNSQISSDSQENEKKKRKGDKNGTKVSVAVDRESHVTVSVAVDGESHVTVSVNGLDLTKLKKSDDSEYKNSELRKQIKEKVIKPTSEISPTSKHKSTTKDPGVINRSEQAENLTEKKKEYVQTAGSTESLDANNLQTRPTDFTKKKKRKKKKKKGLNSNVEMDTSVKKKKKKISIKNFSATDKNSEQKVMGSKQLERQLSKVMSAARLSKYGLGPNAVKMKKKKKKQKQNL